MASQNNRFLLFTDALWCTLFTCVISALLALLFVNISILDPFTKAFQDFEFTDIYYAHNFYNKQPEPEIVVVNVEHADRFAIAQSLQKISEFNPKAVGVDLLFKERKADFLDESLKTALSQTPNLVKAEYFEDGKLQKSHSYFEMPEEQSGFINFNLDGESRVVRDFLGYYENEEQQEPSFAGQLAVVAGYISESQLQENFNTTIPIKYTGGADSFLTLSIDDILDRDDLNVLENTVVFLGYTGTPTGNPYDVEDKHFTPLNSQFAGRSIPDTYGVYIHASILQNLKTGSGFIKTPVWLSRVIAFLFCYVSILLGMYIYKRNAVAFDLSSKLLQLLIPVIILYLALMLMDAQIYLNVLTAVVLVILGLECIDFYIYLQEFIRKRYPWKSYLLD